MPTVSEVVAWSERAFPTRLAESWDAIGLVCGEPGANVDKVLACVDVTDAVVDRAVEDRYDLILAHHPLLLTPVTSVAATTVAGRLVNTLIRGDCALFTAHTNADAANPGVSDALAKLLDVRNCAALAHSPPEPVDKLVVYVPHADSQRLLDALAASGAGQIGEYERCAYLTEGEGTFRPVRGASPTIGTVGDIARVPETRIELVFPRLLRRAVVAALRAGHPYETPAFDISEVYTGSDATGVGRIGDLRAPTRLGDFAQEVLTALPPTPQGVRVAGNPDQLVRRIAVCGGSGESLLESADGHGADVLVTADLKHHRVADHVAAGRSAVIDVAHWASEYPWLSQVASQLAAAFPGPGGLTVDVCDLRTDPWNAALRSTQ